MDGRSDQYALASVLFEMLAGHAPFTGADIQAVMRQHLAADAPSMTQARPTVPKGVAKAVHRALAKSPADRFRTMPEFEKALAGATLPLLARIPMGRARAVFFAGTVLLGLAVVAVVASVWSPGGGEGDSGPAGADTSEAGVPSVVVLALVNRTADPALDDLGEEIASVSEEWLSELGEMIQRFPVLSSGWAAASEREDPGARRRFIRQVWPDSSPATFAVMGDYRDRGDSLEVWFSLQDRDGRVVRTSQSARLPHSGVREHLKRLWCPLASMVAPKVDPWADVTTMLTNDECPRPEAIEAMIEATKEYSRPGGPETWGDWVRRATEEDSTYVYALIKLVDWYAGRQEFSRADSVCRVIDTRFPDLSGPMRLSSEGSCATLRGDKDTALERSRALEERHPSNTLGLGDIAFRGSNRLHEALEALSRWHPPTRNDFAIILDRFAKRMEAEILHLLGEHERELSVAREARAEYPRDEQLLVREVAALIALGQVDEAMDSLEAAADTLRPSQNPEAILLIPALECEVHGCEERSRELLARLLRWYEARPPEERDTPAVKQSIAVQLLNLNRAQEAVPIWRELVDRDPGNLEYLGELGLALAMAGEEGEARAIAKRLSGWDEPWFWGRSTYWRVCIAANLGELEEAVDLLWQADDRGNYVNDPPPHYDPNLRPLRDHPGFQDYVKPRG
jgi:tetratricopeptide (TPR) repeat protein